MQNLVLWMFWITVLHFAVTYSVIMLAFTFSFFVSWTDN